MQFFLGEIEHGASHLPFKDTQNPLPPDDPYSHGGLLAAPHTSCDVGEPGYSKWSMLFTLSLPSHSFLDAKNVYRERQNFPKFVLNKGMNMSHIAFGEFFPEIADKETRVITILDQAIMSLPAGEYARFGKL